MLELEANAGTGRDQQPPVLVVSRESANVALPVVTVVPLTGLSSDRRIYPNEMCLPSGTTALDYPALLMAHQIRTVPKSRLSTHVGTVDDPGLRSAVRTAVRVQLDLDENAEKQPDMATQGECGS